MAELKAVIFDVDGTLADTERDAHRVAFNAAFEAHGLADRWDEDYYGELLWIPGGKPRLDHHLAGRGMPEDERKRLVPSLHEMKNALLMEMIAAGRVPPRPGIPELFAAVHAAGIPSAICTTGSREWVEALVASCIGEEQASRVAAMATGEEVSRPKPDPELYRLVLGKLGCEPESALAIEDSELGFAAASAAGVRCLIFRNGYTARQDFTGAALVVDSLAPPVRVVDDPTGAVNADVINVEVLRRLVA